MVALIKLVRLDVTIINVLYHWAYLRLQEYIRPGITITKGGSITVPKTSCLAGLD
jgi:hypothetical protein